MEIFTISMSSEYSESPNFSKEKSKDLFKTFFKFFVK